MKIAFGLMIAVLAVPVFAQQAGGEKRTFKKQTEYSFEADTIDVDLTRPDGAYVSCFGRVGQPKLIRIREDFKDKVMQSVAEL